MARISLRAASPLAELRPAIVTSAPVRARASAVLKAQPARASNYDRTTALIGNIRCSPTSHVLSSFTLSDTLSIEKYILSVYNNALSVYCQSMKDSMLDIANRTEGLRERKRQETRQRIAETGLRLFLANGYDNTTLDTITAEAGISRRTFFSYFKSKEDLLFIWQSSAWRAVWEDLLTASPDENPLDAVRDTFIRHLSHYANDEMRSIDRLLRSNESLRARKQAAYEEQEQALFVALCEVWRYPQQRSALRMVAMACMGVVRLSLEIWSQQDSTNRPIADVLQEAFANLKLGIQ